VDRQHWKLGLKHRLRSFGSDELEFRVDVDGSLQAPRDRAEAGVEAVDALDFVSTLSGDAEPVANRDPLDHQYAVLCLDFAERLDVVLIGINIDLTRLQRAGKGAGQSACGGSDNVVQRRRVGRVLIGAYAVVLGDFGMHAEHHGLRLGWEVGEPLRPAEPLDLHARYVRDTSHPHPDPTLVALPLCADCRHQRRGVPKAWRRRTVRSVSGPLRLREQAGAGVHFLGREVNPGGTKVLLTMRDA
jgi:hypothetical protein